MKKVAIALLWLLVAGSAWAQTAGTNTVSRNGYYFNATTGQQTDADGNVLTVDRSPDREFFFRNQSIIDDTTAVGMADSSIFYPTYYAKRMFLRVQVTGLGATDTEFARLAIRVKGSFTSPALGDTNEIGYWYNNRASNLDLVSGLDTLTYSHNVMQSSVAQAGGYEFVVEVKKFENKANLKWGGSAVAIVPLTDTRGVFYWYPYTSILCRVLTASVASPRVRIDLVGSAL